MTRIKMHWISLMSFLVLNVGCARLPLQQAEPLNSPTQAQSLPIEARFKGVGKEIEMEVASTHKELEIGLMFRESLPEDRAMLFEIAPPQVVQFWMRSVKIPLDMVFLRNGEIITIVEDTQPCQEHKCPLFGPPEVKIDQVIELKSGMARKLKLKVGDLLLIEYVNYH
jgi:uncharacterized protein